MLKKHITLLLIGAILMISTTSSTVFAQNRIQSAEQGLSESQTNSKPDLKTIFATETAKSKGDNLSAVDFKRFEKESVKPAAREKWTKSEKTIFIVMGISLAVLVTALIILPYKGPTDCNSSRPKDPAACQILFGNP